MNLKNSKTYKNLARAYIGESCARNRYDMLAKLAKKEGYTAMQDLIVKVATNEFNHARMMFSFIDSADAKVIDNIEVEVGIPFKQKLHSLQENLRLSAEDENNEATRIYPAFEKTAREEGFEDIANLYKNIIQVETCHQSLFTQLYTQMKDGTMYSKDMPYKYKCADCGYEETLKDCWEICPLCQAPQGHSMIEIEDESN